MKSSILSALFLFATNAFATVDGITDVAIVVSTDIEGYSFAMKTVPMTSCAGIHEASIDGLWTQPVVVTASLGCGGPVTTQNINAGSCVKSTLKWDDGVSVLKGVELMTAYCSKYWANSWMTPKERAAIKDSFEAALKKAAEFNFGKKTPIRIFP